MSTQLVFLIDTDIPESSDSLNTSFCNAICLTCLRLLHAHSAETEKKGAVNKSKQPHTSVKWGYKFFNSKMLRTKIESHKLNDFKLKFFEEFESEVNRRFEKNVGNSKSQCKASDCLSKTFTEVLADFQWEKPDITSPIKGRKLKKTVSLSSNIIYLFTVCPKSGNALKKFTGKQVPDEDVFLDSLLPSRLFQEFCHVNRLTLNWIDTSTPLAKDEIPSDVTTVTRIIEAAIEKTGGKLSSLDAVTNFGNIHSTYLSNLLEETALNQEDIKDKESGSNCNLNLLPISTTVGFLQPNNNIKNRNNVADRCSSFEIGDTVIKVILHPSKLETQGDKPLFLQSHRHRRDTANKIDLAALDCDVKLDAVLNNTSKPPHLQTYGLVPKHSVTMATGVNMSYYCTEKIQTVRGKIDSTFGLFRGLLASLATRQSLLVLLCKDTGKLALLEPLTVHTATLSLLTQGSSLCIEKELWKQEVDKSASPRKQSSSDDLVNRLVASKHVPKATGIECDHPLVGGVDGKLMDRWYQPGPGSSLPSLIKKLNQRIGDLDFLSKDEVSMLKQLQKCYKQESKPPGLRHTPTLPLVPDPPKPEPDKFDLPYKGRASRASLSRVDMIMNKSRQMVKERGQSEKDDAESGQQDRPGREKPELAAQVSDFKSEEELKEYLSLTYGRVVSGEITSVDSTMQTLVTVALHYLKQTEQGEPETKCQTLLEESLLLSGAKLREKYITAGEEASQEQKIAEYQSQVLLRLEILSNLVNKDQSFGEEEANEEIVGLLRTLSFIWEPGALSQFMQSCLIYNYMHTIPKTLANIYDELMQPLPDVLSNLLSPDNSADRSLLDTSLDEVGPPSARTRSQGSVGPPSSQPASNASVNLDTSLGRGRPGRKLVHHPSLADYGSKRQIVIQKTAKPKEPKSAKRKRHDSGRRKKDKVSKALFDNGKRGGVKLERRQSVAVMERTKKTPKKSTKSKLVLKSPGNYWSSPRRKVVAETPARKQVNQSMFKQDGNQSQDELDDTTVIEESPEKSCDESVKDSPMKGKRAKALLRRSFYSAGPLKRTKNFTQYFQLADRIAGRQRHPSVTAENKPKKLLSFDTDPAFKSPVKDSSFLLSQLVSSPSPAKTTPRKSTRTPSKLVADSPSFNTRSHSSLFSPETKAPSSLPRSSSSHFMSPVSRRQSPRVFVADSDTKSQKETIHTTPEKSPIVGTLTCGLDSPSSNTRQKVSATPTRKSVRAALFAKSPAANRTLLSPRRASPNPTTLISRFLSPSKSQPDKGCRMSPRRILDTDAIIGRSPSKFKDKENVNSMCKDIRKKNIDFGASQSSNNVDLPFSIKPPKSGLIEKDRSTKVLDSPVIAKPSSQKSQRTPSPHQKKVTKTPDSFDKWHRRKPRSNHTSPAINKLKQTQTLTKDSNTETTDYVLKHIPDIKSATDFSLSKVNISSPSRRKRSLLLSPEKQASDSPSKRRRVTRLETIADSFSSVSSMKGSQGFDTAGSFNLSQASTASSCDYFSVSNDEVFLSQNEKPSSQRGRKRTESGSSNFSKKSSMGISESLSSILSPSKKFLPRLVSEEFTYTEDSESPTNSVKQVRRGRNASGTRDSILAEIETSDTNQSGSPNFRKSPASRKFSPNVSAKSLMHLIQSPLIASPVAGASGGNKDSPTHSSVRRTKAGHSSRRSLKLQN